ncbi:MAG: EAL domain-containing protein [Methylococcaceae bacterium]|nr:EAL domain-containing protein [Methylococcaceae bacterium]
MARSSHRSPPVKTLRLRTADLSLRAKLQMATVLAISLATLLVVSALLVNEWSLNRQSLLDKLAAQAHLIVGSTRSAVANGDPDAATEVLRKLEVCPEILSAELNRNGHSVLARFVRAVRPKSGFLAQMPVIRRILESTVQWREPVTDDGAIVGELVLTASRQGFYPMLERYVVVSAVSFGIALALASLLSRQLIGMVIYPLVRLTDLLRAVARRKDYSLRAPVGALDEVGLLAKGVNEMLAQIQIRETDLKSELQERRRAEERLDMLAYYDTVTGLPNRHFFNERLAHAINRAGPFGETTALMFIDLDNFKIINDTLGHHLGDMLLNGVGERLARALRSKDFIFRVGGDEFAVILEDVRNREHVASVAEKLISVFITPFRLEDHDIFISASIGVSLAPQDATEPTSLLRNADTAMYHAKEKGKNTYQLFETSMKGQAANRLNLENSLRRALEKHEFVVHYQPQVDMITRRICGAEALVRWQHPERGMVGPGEFIPIAEETGLIVPLGEWVLRTACAQVAQWEDEGLGSLAIAVNLAGRQFQDDDLVEKVIQVVWETGLDAQLLELELTESTLMDNSRSNMRKLTLLRAAGIRFSIDDFGTGYSSMNYLKRFPISKLKIDQTFVDGLPDNQEDAGITTAIIALAQSLRLQVVAEGVETREQWQFLQEKGCDTIQGYLVSRPLPADQFRGLLIDGWSEE